MPSRVSNNEFDTKEPELVHIYRSYRNKIIGGLCDPNNMISIDEMETTTVESLNSTKDLYLSSLSEILDSTDEKALIRLKKANIGRKE